MPQHAIMQQAAARAVQGRAPNGNVGASKSSSTKGGGGRIVQEILVTGEG